MAVDGELATAGQHNDPLEDLQTDANTVRPVVAGGTGSSTAPTALTALGVVGATLVAQGRLSLTTGVSVTTADVLAAGTLYYVPHVGKNIALYSGTEWVNRSIGSQISLALSLSSGKPYDVFVFDNAGTATLELLIWTNDTTRATALVRQDGVWCKTGALTRRYVGTIYASASNQCEDSAAKRYVWNMYNRVRRSLSVSEPTDNWTYTTAAFRQARATTTNQLDFVRGLDEDMINADVVASSSSSVANAFSLVAIGLDSTTAKATDCQNGTTNMGVIGALASNVARYSGMPGVGRHTLVWLEYAQATGTCTWLGDNGAALIQSGIAGSVLA